MNLRSSINRSLAFALAGIALGCSQAKDSAGDTVAVSGRAPSQPAVTEKGIGPLAVGMSVAEAERTLGTAFLPAGGQQCQMSTWQGAPAGVRAMIEKGVVVRIDVDSGTTSTADNVIVGDPESWVALAYPGRVETMPHKYLAGGHYLVVRPPAPRDSAYRLIFETDGRQVTRFRGGQRPQVEYVERCG